MAKRKITITIDESRLREARALVDAPSTSAVVDIALARLIRAERLRGDLRAYALDPQTPDEITLVGSPRSASQDLKDDTDWATLYADDSA